MLVYIIFFLAIIIAGLIYLIIALKEGMREIEEQRDRIYRLYEAENEKYIKALDESFNKTLKSN